MFILESGHTHVPCKANSICVGLMMPSPVSLLKFISFYRSLNCKSKFTSLSNLRRHVKALHTLNIPKSVANMATKKENKLRIPALLTSKISLSSGTAREYTFIDESADTNSHKFQSSVTHRQNSIHAHSNQRK